jgi:hypothetical protein
MIRFQIMLRICYGQFLDIRDAPDTDLAGYPAIKSGIRPDTGSLKRPDYPAGYPVHSFRYCGISLRIPDPTIK